MTAAKKVTTVKVVQTFTVSAFIGAMPEGQFLALIEDGLQSWNPNVFLGNTDWSCGDGGDWGSSQLEDVTVEVVE